jgi:hypothetical protein
MLQTKEHAPTPYPFIVFTFGFTIQSIKEFGGVSGVVDVMDALAILLYWTHSFPLACLTSSHYVPSL